MAVSYYTHTTDLFIFSLACSVESVSSGLGSKPHCKSASTISGLEWLSVGEWIAGHARDSTVG